MEHELPGHGHAADPSLKAVSLTMAILAVAVACVSVLTHRAHTREIIDQSRLSDGWAFYQSKSTRRQVAQVFSELLTTLAVKDATLATALQTRYVKEASRLETDGLEIMEKNHELQADFTRQEHRAALFDLGEALLEAAIVVTSITLLTRKRLFWFVGFGLAAVGVGFAVSALAIF